jgi:hypothetical protein
MAWEKEFDELDKDQSVHRIGLVNRAITTTDGKPARHQILIMIGTGADGRSCPHCSQPVRRGLNLTDAGELVDESGKEIKPADVVRETIQKLEAHHGRMDQYARRHGAVVYAGPKRK